MGWLEFIQIAGIILLWRGTSSIIIRLLSVQYFIGFFLYNVIVENVDPSIIEFVYLFCLFLASKAKYNKPSIPIVLKRKLWLLCLGFSVLMAIVGFRLNTFSVGLNETPLPFRLAGIIEVFAAYMLYESFAKSFSSRMVVSIFLILMSGLFLLKSGSKFYALVPIIYGITEVFDRKRSMFLLFFILISMIVVNPFKIRDLKKEGKDVRISSLMIKEAPRLENFTPLIRYLAGRFCGKEVLIWLEQEKIKYNGGSIQSYMNSASFSEGGVSYASGFVGYFYLKSRYNLSLFSFVTVAVLYFLVALEVLLSNLFSKGLIGIVLFPILVDGPMSDSSVFKGLFLVLIFLLLYFVYESKVNHSIQHKA